MKTLGYYNGQIGEFDSLSVPMGDRSHFFGDGVYDATYSRNYKIYDLDEHVDRLYNSARLLEIEISETKDEMKQILSELVRKMDTGENFVYFQVTRGSGPRNHLFPESKKTNLLVSISHKEIADAMQQNMYLQREITAARELYNDTINEWNKDIFAWPTKKIVAAKNGYTTRIPFIASKEIKEMAKGVFF